MSQLAPRSSWGRYIHVYVPEWDMFLKRVPKILKQGHIIDICTQN